MKMRVNRTPLRIALALCTFEHPIINAGFYVVQGKDQTSIAKAQVKGNGWSAWATRQPKEVVALELEALNRIKS